MTIEKKEIPDNSVYTNKNHEDHGKCAILLIVNDKNEYNLKVEPLTPRHNPLNKPYKQTIVRVLETTNVHHARLKTKQDRRAMKKVLPFIGLQPQTKEYNND